VVLNILYVTLFVSHCAEAAKLPSCDMGKMIKND